MEEVGRGSHQHKRGLWTEEEDKILMEYVEVHGKGQWNRIAKKTGLKRCGKSCRLRWVNYLSPNVKKGNFTDEEEDLIIRLHKLLGNRWSLIAGRVPGRTDNQVKNYWNTHLSKRNGGAKRQRTEPCTQNPGIKSATCSKDSETMTTDRQETTVENPEQETTTADNNLTGNTYFPQQAPHAFFNNGQINASSPSWTHLLGHQMSSHQSLMQFSDEFLQFDFAWNDVSSFFSD